MKKYFQGLSFDTIAKVSKKKTNLSHLSFFICGRLFENLYSSKFQQIQRHLMCQNPFNRLTGRAKEMDIHTLEKHYPPSDALG